MATRRRRSTPLLPINGRVTREDIIRLHREFAAETRRALRSGEIELDEVPTVSEFVEYLVGAIVDPAPPHRPRGARDSRPDARARRSQAQRRRREREAAEAGLQVSAAA